MKPSDPLRFNTYKYSARELCHKKDIKHRNLVCEEFYYSFVYKEIFIFADIWNITTYVGWAHSSCE